MEISMDAKKLEAIEDVLDYFDFDKVHKVMTCLNWTWHDTEGVPMVGDLRKRARELLKEVPVGGYRATGGFEVRQPEENYYSLAFVLTDWNNYD
jgi:hypothetical protein